MTFLRAVAAGIGIGALAAVLWVAGALLLPVAVEMAAGIREGGGWTGAATVGSDSTLLVALVGFVIGFLLDSPGSATAAAGNPQLSAHRRARQGSSELRYQFNAPTV